MDKDLYQGAEGRTPYGQGVDFAVPANVWKTRGMFVSLTYHRFTTLIHPLPTLRRADLGVN